MQPKVSVCLVTYNHEKYLRQCLNTILSQITDFEFEVIIGEDKSTDNTLSIAREFQQLYPNKISILTSETNVGMVANWERTLRAGRGQYLAIIEGDDYWIDNNKLQAQADLLDSNPGCALCFHDVEVEFGDGIIRESTLGRVTPGEELTINDLILRNWFVPTCSVMVRQKYLPAFPPFTVNLQAIDLVVELMVAMHGGLAYIDRKMGMYRIHSGGISQMQWLGNANRLQLTLIKIFEGFDAFSNRKYHSVIKQRLERIYRVIMKQNPPRSAMHIRAMMKVISFNPKANLSMLKDWIIVNFIPQKIYRIYKSIK